MMTMNRRMPREKLSNLNEDEGEISQDEVNILPRFGKYQLIGDTLLVRFADQILKQPSEIKHGSRTIGYCVSGQGIDLLRKRIKLKTYPLSSHVMLLIGTSDVLCGGNIYTMTKHFNALLSLLRKNVEKLVILTLPPIPKLSATYYHWSLIRQYNSFLKSLGDGKSVVVADICPLFTKFRGALEYELNVHGEPRGELINCCRRKKSFLNYRRRNFYEQKRPCGRYRFCSERSESDYQNSTDTDASADSEALSSEISQGKESYQSTDISEVHDSSVRQSSKRCSERVQSPVRFLVRTLQSVFGKDVLSRRKMVNEEEEKEDLNSVEQSEKKLRKSPETEKRCRVDLNENLYGSDGWKVDSDEDSLCEHVYKSQEEIEYEIPEVGCQIMKERNEEFSRFVESLNENEDVLQSSFANKKWKRSDHSKNEEPEDSESSSSSDVDSPKKQIYPFVDHQFRYFLEKSHVFGESDSSMNIRIGNVSCPTPKSESVTSSPFCEDFFVGAATNLHSESLINASRNIIEESRALGNISGISEREKLILQLASKICHLQYYEIFYQSGKKRIDMVHLNHRGLLELKNFLIANNYV